MRAAILVAPYRVELTEVDVPSIETELDVVVRVTRSAICGTDLHPYRGELPTFPFPVSMGHEFVGIVHEAGSASGWSPGDRVIASDVVACGRCAPCALGWHYQCPEASLFGYGDVVGVTLAGGQADFVRVPFADTVLLGCPDAVGDDHAVLVADVLSTAYTAARRMDLVPGAPVAVVGGGPLGLLGASCLRSLGAGSVVVIDPTPARREAARTMGFDAIDPGGPAASSLSGAFTGVIEAVGTTAALRSAISAAAPRGTVVVVGAHHDDDLPFPAGAAFGRELTIRFAVGDPITVGPEVLALLESGQIDPSPVISHVLPLAEVADGYRIFEERRATKVLLAPDHPHGRDHGPTPTTK